MNAIGLAFTISVCILMFGVQRQAAAVLLLVGALYMTPGQVLDVGPAHFTVMRILVTVGFIRVISRGETISRGMLTIDRLVLLWAFVLVGSSAFHTSDAWIYRAGIVWTDLGCYFLFRIFLRDTQDVVSVCKALCLALIPVAGIMLYEKATQQNLFAVLGGVNPWSLVRDGHVRAAGPFAHPILAGTVGATCIMMALATWQRHRMHALAGLLAAGSIVFAATSSGPIMMVAFSILGLSLWHVRQHMSGLRWAVFVALVILDRLMNDPVYFLMARVDISGGSQGYYRAQLIRSSIDHLSEWWMAGTDYTRHWMPSGNFANTRHTDITNQVLAMGVLGGLPLLIIFVCILALAFAGVGRALRQRGPGTVGNSAFIAWLFGATLFGHVMNFMSISLFDQSIVFFYLVLAGIGAFQTSPQASRPSRTRRSPAPARGHTKKPALAGLSIRQRQQRPAR